jgi:hypothetical protein
MRRKLRERSLRRTTTEKSDRLKEKTKKEKGDEKEKGEKKEKKKKKGQVQPQPDDLSRAINDVVGSLITSLEPLFHSCFSKTGRFLEGGRTPKDYILDRKCDIHKEFEEFRISQRSVEIEFLDALTELFDDEDTDDYVTFVERFHDIWESYINLRREHRNEYFVLMEQCHDKYWDEDNEKPK